MTVVVTRHAIDRALNTNRLAFHPVYGKKIEQINDGENKIEETENLIKNLIKSNNVYKLEGTSNIFVVNDVVMALCVDSGDLIVKTIFGCMDSYFWCRDEQYNKRSGMSNRQKSYSKKKILVNF